MTAARTHVCCSRCFRRVPIAPMEFRGEFATPVAHVVLKNEPTICAPTGVEPYRPELHASNLEQLLDDLADEDRDAAHAERDRWEAGRA